MRFLLSDGFKFIQKCGIAEEGRQVPCRGHLFVELVVCNKLKVWSAIEECNDRANCKKSFQIIGINKIGLVEFDHCAIAHANNKIIPAIYQHLCIGGMAAPVFCYKLILKTCFIA